MSRSLKIAVAAAVLCNRCLLAVTAACRKSKKKIALGREALPQEVKAWDIDIRPDGLGLPVGKGSVKEGEKLFIEQCASCHGEFGEGKDRWPVLAGGFGTLKSRRSGKDNRFLLALCFRRCTIISTAPCRLAMPSR